jgi:DNA-binding transcriptional LysR family regulator
MHYDKVFITVADLKSFSAAARELNKTPSSISKHIGLLENKLGEQLFHRTTRALTVTKAGEVFYDYCKEVAQLTESTLTELSDMSKSPSGKIIMTWPSVLSSSKEISVLKEFCKKYPGIKIDVKVSNEPLCLVSNKIDFAIRVGFFEQLKDSSLVAIKIGYLQPIFCATPEIVNEFGMPSSIPDVMDLPQVVPTYLPIKQVMKKYFPEIEKFNEDDHHQASDIFTLYNMVKLGLGAGLIGKHFVEKELKEGALVDLTKEKIPKLPIYLVFTKLRYTPKKNRLLIDFYKENFLTMIEK